MCRTITWSDRSTDRRSAGSLSARPLVHPRQVLDAGLRRHTLPFGAVTILLTGFFLLEVITALTVLSVVLRNR